MSDRNDPATPPITALRQPAEFLARRGGALLACCARAGAHRLAQELAAVLGVTIDQVADGARQELARRARRSGGPDGR